MILSKIMQSMYLKIYISIVTSNTQTYVSVHTLKGSKVKDLRIENFEGEEVSQRMISFIDTYISESPFYYVSYLDNSSHQGALPTCKLEEFLEVNGNETYKTICYDGWSSYTSIVDLSKLEKKYASIGLDFVFSPFSILENFFKDKIEAAATLYALVQEDNITIAIFEHSKLKYGEFLNIDNTKFEHSIMTQEEEKNDLSFDEDQLSVNLEDIDIDEGFNELDDFADIEDLDSIDDFEDFTDVSVNEKEIKQEQHLREEEHENAGFNEDYRRFSAIKNALKTYYTDEKYENSFIESIYIASACDLDHSLKNYLEEELFLKVFVRQVEITTEVFDLAKREKI